MSPKRAAGRGPDRRQRPRARIVAPGSTVEESPFVDVPGLLQELQSSRVELELQNDELRRAKHELQISRDAVARSEHHYRDLYENAPVGFVTLDASARITDANHTATTILGTVRRALLGRRFSDFVATDHQDAWHRHLRALLHGHTPKPLALALEAPGGRQIWAELAGAVGSDAGSLRIALLDMTERERAEQAARESERRVRTITDALPVLVSYIDREERYRFVNAAYQTWFDVPLDQIRGRKLLEVLGEAAYARVADYVREGLRGVPLRFEDEIPYKNAGPRFVSVAYAPDVDEAGVVHGFYAVIHDLTALRRAEAALRAAAAEAALAEQRERRALAADLHDDVGQLLSLASLELSELGDAQPEAQADLYFKARELVARARERVTSLSFQLSPPILHDVGLVAAAQWLGEDLGRSYRLEVSVEAPDGELGDLDEPLRVTLFRALRELLINVARHARTDRARVRIRRSGGQVEVEVRDEGVGFDPDAVEHGFGLRSVRDRIAHMGGSLRIETRPGGGTRVVACAPIAYGSGSDAPRKEGA